MSGNVEVRYDPEKDRVIYEPVSIDPRVLVPRVIRHEIATIPRYQAPATPRGGIKRCLRSRTSP